MKAFQLKYKVVNYKINLGKNLWYRYCNNNFPSSRQSGPCSLGKLPKALTMKHMQWQCPSDSIIVLYPSDFVFYCLMLLALCVGWSPGCIWTLGPSACYLSLQCSSPTYPHGSHLLSQPSCCHLTVYHRSLPRAAQIN